MGRSEDMNKEGVRQKGDAIGSALMKLSEDEIIPQRTQNTQSLEDSFRSHGGWEGCDVDPQEACGSAWRCFPSGILWEKGVLLVSLLTAQENPPTSTTCSTKPTPHLDPDRVYLILGPASSILIFCVEHQYVHGLNNVMFNEVLLLRIKVRGEGRREREGL